MEINESQLKEIESRFKPSKREQEQECAEFVKELVIAYNRNLRKEDQIDPEKIYNMARVMNVGETHEEIAWIYDRSCNWREHPEAIELNKRHGECSVKILEELGVGLTSKEKEEIAGVAKGIYPSLRAQILKAGEVYVATQRKRVYRGERKDESTEEEMEEILKENGIFMPIINVLKNVIHQENNLDSQDKERE